MIFFFRFLSIFSVSLFQKYYEYTLIILLRLMGFNNPNELLNGEKRILIKLLRKINKPIFFDIGSHQGKFIEFAIEANKDVEVHAFEIQKNFFKKLVKKFKDFSNVKLYNYGIFNKNIKLPIYINKNSTGETKLFKEILDLQFYSGDFMPPKKRKIHQINNVQFKTLSFFIKINKIRKIDYIKIDAEGCDLKIIIELFESIKRKEVDVNIKFISFELNYNYIFMSDNIYLLKKYQNLFNFKLFRILPNSIHLIDLSKTYLHSNYIKAYQNLLIKF
jgi:FkbM family methyltransferase